jgi:4-amino-4-deoxy-L-arabinose transferase-like glycosyltransferase
MTSVQGESPTKQQGLKNDILILTALAGFLFFVSLGARDLWNPNEPIYGRAVAEMEERGDWLIPTVNGTVFAEKPILYYWGALAVSKLSGTVNEWSLRVPSALAGIASVLLTYLLVVPYVGRRRAMLSAMLLMSMYQVWWASRAVQMDILVLAASLGVIVPLIRFLDFKTSAAKSFAWAGIAAGLGFAAKGPVAWVVPTIALAGYGIFTRRFTHFLRWKLGIGVVVAFAVCLPWYGLLWAKGETSFLYEMLFRQNVTRFVDAWDHQQPWWYYLKYLWLDYAPWSWLLPAAFLIRPLEGGEKKISNFCWVWICGVIVFFSLSDSKRAPYILPIAPAAAILVSAVVDRWLLGKLLERKARIAASIALSLLAVAMITAGVALFIPAVDLPEGFGFMAIVLGLVMGVSGMAIGYGVLKTKQHPKLAPYSVFGLMFSLFLCASIWILPAVDSVKSARGFATKMINQIDSSGGTVASYQFWDWRAGYSYYANRSIPILKNPKDLQSYWNEESVPFILVEEEHAKEVGELLSDSTIVLEGKIGNTDAFLFSKIGAQSHFEDQQL